MPSSPSKPPLLTLLKQARAFGVGVVVATQNPVDLDYKALSNAGTWLLGRLQTERDQGRVLDGLAGVAAGGKSFDRRAMEKTLAGLRQRIFLLHSAHADEPVVFHTRWAMSYLTGLLTRPQIERLMAPAECRALAERRAWFRYHVTLSQPNEAWEGCRGRLDMEQLTQFVPEPAASRCFAEETAGVGAHERTRPRAAIPVASPWTRMRGGNERRIMP